MRFPPLDRYFTGISVPVAALRSGLSCGAGEFADLVPLGRWCVEAGLDFIQLLPVNDTGGNSSPYSAISAFALHPLYLRLQDMPGAAPFAGEIDRFRAESDARARVASGRLAYRATLEFKRSIVQRVCEANAPAIGKDEAFRGWREANPWVIAYAVFAALQRRNLDAPWSAWPEMSDPSPAQIGAWWDAHPGECLPQAWAQYLLESQLSAASRELSALGISLKGDLPILMTTESADVWDQREYFDLTARAGAPPDMFSPDGQNWGFPVYDWDRLGNDDYRWWKDRLRQAGKFFQAFRIDHVLGFFRIWRIPRGETTGLTGRFSPSSGLAASDLESLGFDRGRLRWLSVPHISGMELLRDLGPEAARVAAAYLVRIGSEDLFNLKPEIDGEAAIHALAEPAEVKRALLAWHTDRTLIDDGEFFPAWYMERTKGFQSLSEPEKSRLRGLVRDRRRESEAAWEQRGAMLLSALQGATDMLVCAEDLGDVPPCVPRVLDRLGILGLRIVRWSRAYEAATPGTQAAFVPPTHYPRLSVCTPSVHDTTTIRGWWEEDAGERELFFRSIGGPGPCPARMTPDLLERILVHCLDAASLLCMFQLQELLDLDEASWATDPAADRINVPGTVNEVNWTWRMPLALEDLASRSAFTGRIRSLVEPRRARALEAGR
jgi:4-alpha-glucanotransferase